MMGEYMVAISSQALRMDADALNELFVRLFPHQSMHQTNRVVTVEPGFLVAEMETDKAHLRPGALISGPTQMGFADMAAYMLVLAHIGPVEMAVTSALNYQFLRPCPPATLTAKSELLRLGKRLAVMDVRLYSGDDPRAIGQANVTYAIPG